MQRVAQDWLVLDLTHGSGTALGITTGLQFLPLLLFSLWGGAVADRYPKRTILMFTQAIMGVLALILGVLALTGEVRIWHVYALAFALGLVTVVDNPTRQTFAVEMVGKADMPNAIALNSAVFNLGRIAGPAVAGLVISAVGTPAAFAGQRGLLRRGDHRAEADAPGRTAARPSGSRGPRASSARRWPTSGPGRRLWSLDGAGVLRGHVRHELPGHQRADVPRACSTRARGRSGSAPPCSRPARWPVRCSPRAGRTPAPGCCWSPSFAFGALEVLNGLMPSFWTFLVVLFPIGVVLLTFTTAANSATQLGTTADMRGRVMGLYLLVFLGGAPLGSPLVGWVGQAFGPRISLIAGGVISAAAAAVVGAAAGAQPRRPGPRLPAALRLSRGLTKAAA